ncbi:ABC transporter ATP-binding protein [Yersinia alsatica]|uniref:ABC transporter ATP-binding protein n=1 Tax=Yersinia alsatica TaxID=2890317 RepID=UPI0032EB8733
MSSIIVKDICKSYKKYNTRYDRLIEWFSPFKSQRHTVTDILKDITFTVNPGEAVGIIGVNGAGKSTLLKIITGTTAPTRGTVNIYGRVAALLELGMGFHPDFTGRENVFMSGQLLGMSIEQIKNLMPHIEDFAEIGQYIDQPVRTYSSGMQVRLAFSVATALRPEILIVDEALSVGDAYFQAKCFSRIKEYKSRGTTLLIVSHDQAAIANLCSRAILIEKGQIVADTVPTDVMNLYNAKLSKTSETMEVKLHKGKVISGDHRAIVEGFYILDETQHKIETIKVAQKCTLCFEVDNKQIEKGLTLGFHIRDRLGNVVFGTNTLAMKTDISNLGKKIIKFNLDMNIGVGEFSVSAALHKERDHYEECYHWVDGIGSFFVVAPDKIFVGSTWLDANCEVINIGV